MVGTAILFLGIESSLNRQWMESASLPVPVVGERESDGYAVVVLV